ncbi:hypothetical protein TGMAS_225680 [Toxoplasma gondii MAS]|uniref:Uncharacterized protein n=1 Tax=Toxoplasma gondii MAS TaxID=943118 RepID=A0A086QMW8_TOXGO|nr:hypothetical protein TGMAS_225680 [Toxoplasma gondii MAS]
MLVSARRQHSHHLYALVLAQVESLAKKLNFCSHLRAAEELTFSHDHVAIRQNLISLIWFARGDRIAKGSELMRIVDMHFDALKHAGYALSLLQRQAETFAPKRLPGDYAALLVASHFSVGVQKEYLHIRDAVLSYSVALQIARASLGINHPMIPLLRKGISSLRTSGSLGHLATASMSRRFSNSRLGSPPRRGVEISAVRWGARTNLASLRAEEVVTSITSLAARIRELIFQKKMRKSLVPVSGPAKNRIPLE